MNFNSNQRSKVIQGLRSFKDTLPTKVKKLLKQKGEVYSELIENWRMFVGDELFSLSSVSYTHLTLPTIYSV